MLSSPRTFLFLLLALVMAVPSASAQQTQTQPPVVVTTADSRVVTETRPATVSVTGDTGLWFLSTAEILPHGTWSLSLYRANADFGQGYTDVSNFPISFAYGIADRLEVFGSYTAVTRIDRDTRPLFSDAPEGAGGGIVNEYPLVRQQWSGNSRGDLRVGAKINLLSQADGSPMAFAVRGLVKVPTGNEDTGASTGKMDYALDLIASTDINAAELTASGGVIMRGDPDGFDLTNGIRWGVGAKLFNHAPVQLTAELYGERYMRNTITGPAGFMADDFSVAPITTNLKNPLTAALGLTFQTPNGVFMGAGLNWSSAVSDRRGEETTFRDQLGVQVRVGYHPGVRRYVALVPAPEVMAPAPPPPAPTPTPTPTPAPVVQAPVVQTPAPAPAEKDYVFEDVHFDFDRNTLRPDALAVLDEAIIALKAEPGLELRIEGHTCNIGTAEYNLALAERRATAVREYLGARGVDPGRLSMVSYGEERPKHDNTREETRRLNRRAALVVSVVRR